MACEPDMARLITAFSSFLDKHKLAHIKKTAHTKFQKQRLFLRDHYVLKTTIEKSESIVNNISFTSQKRLQFAHEQISTHTHS